MTSPSPPKVDAAPSASSGPGLLGFDEILGRADARAAGLAIAVAGGADRTVLQALRAAADRGWVAPIVVGPEAEVRRAAEAAEVDLRNFTFLDADDEGTANAAVAAVRAGRASILMKGRISTPALMQALIDPGFGLRDGRSTGQVVLMEILRDSRRFLLTDTGINVRPKLPTKVDLLRSAIEVARALGQARPRVAIMGASEEVSSSVPETLHAAELQRRSESGEFPDSTIRGPLSFDLAYEADSAGKKGVAGPVVGKADLMLFPDLASANLTVKAIMYTSDCRFGGILVGTTAPVVFMSRADTVETRLRSIALALATIA